MEEQCTHENIMTQEETIKACKPPREPKPAAVCDGTLAKPSLRKLNNKLRQISGALAGMEDAIKPAKDSAVIAPAMVDKTYDVEKRTGGAPRSANIIHGSK